MEGLTMLIVITLTNIRKSICSGKLNCKEMTERHKRTRRDSDQKLRLVLFFF